MLRESRHTVSSCFFLKKLKFRNDRNTEECLCPCFTLKEFTA